MFWNVFTIVDCKLCPSYPYLFLTCLFEALQSFKIRMKRKDGDLPSQSSDKKSRKVLDRVIEIASPVLYVVLDAPDFKVARGCLTDKNGLPIQLGEKIDAGGTGTVFPVPPAPNDSKQEKKTQQQVVLKIIPFKSKGYQLEQFEHEVEAAKEAGKVGVGPEVYEAWTCAAEGNVIGLISMQRLVDAVPLRRLYKPKEPILGAKKLLRLVLQKLNKLYGQGWMHGDPNIGNIIISNDRQNAWLVDYGNAVRIANDRPMKLLFKESKWAVEQKLITVPFTSEMAYDIDTIFRGFQLHSSQGYFDRLFDDTDDISSTTIDRFDSCAGSCRLCCH